MIQPEGTTVQLKCLATGKPTPEIRWKKNGKILSEDEYGLTQYVSISAGKVRFRRSMISLLLPRTQILDIKDLRQSDTGNYTCELFNPFGTLNATFILHVTGIRCDRNVSIARPSPSLQNNSNSLVTIRKTPPSKRENLSLSNAAFERAINRSKFK